MNADQYETYVVGNGLDTLQPLEIVSIVAQMTANDIKTEAVRQWLRESSLWYTATPTTMAGTIQTAIDGGKLPRVLVAALGEFYSSLFGDSALALSTATRPDIAARIFGGWQGIVAVGAATQDDADAFFALGGGLPFALTTVEQISQAKAEYANQQAADLIDQAAKLLKKEYDSKFNEHVSPSIGAADRAGMIAGLRSLADAMEA